MVGLMNVSNQGFVVPLTITITMSVMMETCGVWRWRHHHTAPL